MNSIMKGACLLPIYICALIKETFKRTISWFIDWDLKANSMLRVGHQYQECIMKLLEKINHKRACVMCIDMIDKISNFRFKRYFLHIIIVHTCLS